LKKKYDDILPGLKIRSEAGDDHLGIDLCHDIAFSNEVQSGLVNGLRGLPRWRNAISHVALYFGEIVGHCLIYPIKCKQDGRVVSASVLGPISVVPEFQNMGIGTALIHSCIAALDSSFRPCFVTGPAEFFSTFGFQSCEDFKIANPFGEDQGSFMVMSEDKEILQNIHPKFPCTYLEAK